MLVITVPTRVFQSTHPVRGGTVGAAFTASAPTVFQSTHPVRGGTAKRYPKLTIVTFQSTHPVRGGTSKRRIRKNKIAYFNPPTP